MSAEIFLPGTSFADAVDAVRRGEKSSEEAADEILRMLTDRELLWLLDGDKPMVKSVVDGARTRTNFLAVTAGRIDRIGIPGLRFTDGPRGVGIAPSTSFPVSIARAATWDVDIERRVAAAIATEARAHGANFWGGLCINVAPFPGWGRAQESYGEDPLLIGEMGSAAIEGAKPWVITSVKHFALNSMEEARFQVDVSAPEDILHERYLPHFRRAVEAGVDSVMSSYNSVNGVWAGENPHLLTEILRDQWGFTGFVHTDWVWGLRHPVESVAAGQDVEMPFRQQRAHALPAALRSGELDRADVVRAGARVLRTQIEFAARAQPTPPRSVVAGAEHRALAREVAQRGTVLLRNQNADGTTLLPLVEQDLHRVAVLGRLADRPNLGDTGSSNVRPPNTVSVVQGLRERLGSHRVVTDARGADAAVVVVGLTPKDEGEALIAIDADTMALFGGVMRRQWVAKLASRLFKFSQRWWTFGGDRSDLRLHSEDVALIRAVAAANPRTVVIVIGGGTVIADPWDRDVAAVLMAWYPGMEGGRSLADILFGDVEPGGRMPVTTPVRQSQLPQVDWRARAVTYDRWWGQRKLDHDGVTAGYPLGFGLGYTTFTIADLTLGPVDGEHFDATVKVSNTGDRDGRHVVQVYAVREVDGRPVRHLVGFTSVAVSAGESVPVTVDCSTRPLQRWTHAGVVLDGGEVTVEAGGYCGDPNAARSPLLF
ncbi:beta-glucosidase [Mycolicibacterium moriokaense]|uniref:Glycosyl hydrolase n=1 Tax=Mycolicibacterium moriokaense TaxID=39691 RepID=A0AAD1H6W3_9MYCO|nr:glycoside hydrolase family 3 C-terminal domain-containing protein [Mycolicibacterium moriokaense]MCV7039037.1 glycoside hydrolase family 3 C-terminal domain-containing protein [Mycolicibacterium moriokaense]ORB20371.1 beta-glucosidase [Mycolicibacterium moriokaense]BBW99937.1 glycosyl hydrolase [Mycolicibacterium moriokaense]